MNASTRSSSLHLLRLIIELRGSDMPSNNVFLAAISELEDDDLSADLAVLEEGQLIAWSEVAEQWTPTMRGLLIGINLPAYEPALHLLSHESSAACA